MTDRERFIAELRATNRTGIERVIAELDKLGFFRAPASTRFHGCVPGGLLAHSMNVLMEARAIRECQIRLAPELAERLPEDSVVIAALLHDVCKAEIYKQVQKWRKDKNDKLEQYATYTVDDTELPLGHGEKSVIRLLRWGLELTDDEVLAIRWHMSGFDIPPCGQASFSAAGDRSPLVSVLIAADILASRVLEGR